MDETRDSWEKQRGWSSWLIFYMDILINVETKKQNKNTLNKTDKDIDDQTQSSEWVDYFLSYYLSLLNSINAIQL